MIERTKEFKRQLALAQSRVAEMDKVDGFKQCELGYRECVGTCISAMEYGLNRPENIDGAFDCLVMLQQMYDEMNRKRPA